ncbi:MAG: O-antigen ligase family protein [Elusimicrobia bacterium]|nr:O-antigen ligase family protein [Elusimicrobiota bacterium]
MPAERLLAFAFALLGAALPLSLAASNASLALLSAGLLLSVCGAVSRRAALARLGDAARTPLFAALAAYAAASLISGLSGADPVHSLSIWPKDLHKLWVVLAFGAALDAERRRLFARGLAAGAGAAALIGIAQTAAAALAGGPYLRAHAFMHPVSYGESLGLIVLGLLSWDDDLLPRPLRRAAVAALGTALLLNQTRAALAGIVAGLAAAAWADPRWRRRLAAGAATAAAAAGAWELWAGERSLRALLSGGAASAQNARLVLWRVACGIFRDHPLFGSGPGNYRLLYPTYHSGLLDGEKTWGSAHNLFLHQAAERGLVGLIALALVCLVLGRDAWRRAREHRDAWSLWALSSGAAFLVMNLTEIALQTEQVATLFLILALLPAVEAVRRG